MKNIISLTIVAFALASCQFPETTSNVSIEQPAIRTIDADTTAALNIVNVAPFVGDSWAYRPDDAAVYLRRRLYFQLVEEGHLKRIVDPGESADLDMTVTITAFEHETPSVSTELREPGKDGISQMQTEVILADQETGKSILIYVVSAQAPSADTPIGAEIMLDEAVVGIAGGLQQGAGSKLSRVN